MKILISAITVNDISLIVSILFFIGTAILGYFFGYVPRVKKKQLETLELKLKHRESELLALYKDVDALLQIENILCTKANLSKIKAREGFTISARCEPKRVSKRINELEQK